MIPSRPINPNRCSHGAVSPYPESFRCSNCASTQRGGYSVYTMASMRAFLCLVSLWATVFLCADNTLGQIRTNSPQPQLQRNAPAKTQTSKTQTATNQPKPHQPSKQHGHGHSGGGGGVGVGMGVNVDLGGIGQRGAEPDPFAVPAAPQPVVARTEEKPKGPRKKPREVATSDPFSHVQLTGPQAKPEMKP
jgi:hypothetical protein